MFGGACMSEKLDFYEVNVDYVKYLKQFDSRIPNVEYQNRNKFLCGTLFKINGLNYFAPVSSFNIKQSSNYVIEVGNVPVGSVRYSFMFPVPDAEIKQKVINNESDYQYRFLLRQELKYCNKNREVIQSKAKAIYHKALDKNTTYHQFCCDFQLLEKKCKEWIYDKTIEKHEKCIYKGNKLSKGAIQELYNMKDTYDFTYAQDLRHFIGLLLDDYCPTQLKIFDSDIVYDVIKDLKQFKMELTGNRIFGDCCLECNALLNKDLEQLKEDLSYTDMDELSEEEKEIVKEFLDSYKGNYNLIEFDCNGQCSTIWIRDNLTDSELEACQIIDKHFDVFKNLEDRVDIELFGIRKEEISTEMNEIEEDLDEIEM